MTEALIDKCIGSRIWAGASASCFLGSKKNILEKQWIRDVTFLGSWSLKKDERKTSFTVHPWFSTEKWSLGPLPRSS